MTRGYSRLVSPDELLEEQVESALAYAHVEDLDDAYEVLSEEGLIEVGREDYSSKVGSKAVIDPCPFCGGEHAHGFGLELEQGYVVEVRSHCDKTDRYWLVWLGKGEGEWLERDDFLREPTFGPKDER